MWHPSIVTAGARDVTVRFDFDPSALPSGQPDAKSSVPIIINNFNRLDCLKQLIAKLDQLGYRRLYIIDNASDYPPLLDYYRSCSPRVFYLSHNVGYLSLWQTGISRYFAGQYFVYTDPDVVPVTDQRDIVGLFRALLDRYPKIDKVGCALRLDDLPDHYPQKQHVLEHEQKFWRTPIEPDVYLATLDTTFALYRPGAWGGYWASALRVAGDCSARHLPWYADGRAPSEEDLHYARRATTSTHWTRAGLSLKDGQVLPLQRVWQRTKTLLGRS